MPLPIALEVEALAHFGKICSLDRILRHARCPISRATIQEKLECSRATATRVIKELRDYFGAPVEYDRSAQGYWYAKT